MSQNREEIAVGLYNSGFLCSQAVFAAFADRCGIKEEAALKIGACFGAGMRKGEVCGACSGALMVLGMLYGQSSKEHPRDRDKANKVTIKMMDRFQAVCGSYICNELLGCDITTMKGVEYARENNLFTEFCPEMVANAVKILEQIIAEQDGEDFLFQKSPIIRRMRSEDAEAVTDILMNSWKKAYRGIVSDEHLDHMNRDALIERRRAQYKDYIVAVSDDRIVGYCWYVNNSSFTEDVSDIDCEVVALYVMPGLERKGLGRKMLLYAVDDLKKQGRKNMIIWCLKENTSARMFYEKMGGTIVGEHKIHIGNQDYDEVGFLYRLDDMKSGLCDEENK